MRNRLIVLCLMLGTVVPASAQVSISIGFPNVSIGINLPLYPELEPIPGYPVYYAPRLDSNYFFYDGMYWVYQRDSWYASSWYNGPWALVDPEAVPLYVLRIPVRYYRQPPMYFRGWRLDAPPRWGDYWGYGWAQHRSGWDRWDHRSAHAPAPLPIYQRQYSGERYPRGEQQQKLHDQQYRYQPQDPVVRQQYQGQRVQRAPESPQRGTPGSQQERHPAPQGAQRYNPYLPPPSVQQRAPTAPPAQSPQESGKHTQRPAPNLAPPQRSAPPVQQQSQPRQQGAAPHQPAERNAHDQGRAPQGKGTPRQSEKEQRPGQERGRDRADDRGQGQQR
ncbi:MAG: hypothetical protein Q8O37_01210 [Sulfuricellaceae bacterium]|nr:hypothetical protein [Sulfuricellaceae bacterium]